jgi:hypothetical protein
MYYQWLALWRITPPHLSFAIVPQQPNGRLGSRTVTIWRELQHRQLLQRFKHGKPLYGFAPSQCWRHHLRRRFLGEAVDGPATPRRPLATKLSLDVVGDLPATAPSPVSV